MLRGETIFYKEEPEVICDATLVKCVLNHGLKGEAARLFNEQEIHVEEIKEIRLEFQRIIRIDHLWPLKNLVLLDLSHNNIEKIENINMLTTLIELDLSFNKIKVIENLEELVNLERLTLCQNKITKLENMDTLEKLMIFSIAYNQITKEHELHYLRKFRNLRSVSVKGNPCVEAPGMDRYTIAVLHTITYINYVKVSEEERAVCRDMFRYAMRQLDEQDEEMERKFQAREAYREQVEFSSKCFVEHLDDLELLDQMFEDDPEGYLLTKVSDELNPLIDEYREAYREAMEKLVVFAKAAYTVREDEIKLFYSVKNKAVDASVENSKKYVDEYNLTRNPLVARLTEMQDNIKRRVVKPADVEDEVFEMSEQFDDNLHKVWKALMSEECVLFERMEEMRTAFSVNLQAMISDLADAGRAAFGRWRELECIWTTAFMDTMIRYLQNPKLIANASPAVMEYFNDRDLLLETVGMSNERHLRNVDAREDTLLSRAHAWLEQVIKESSTGEVDRDRARIVEINFFCDNERELWADIQSKLVEPVDSQTARLLFDDAD